MNDDWKSRADMAEAECLEQARLNGMGSEREAKLISEIQRMKRDTKWTQELEAEVQRLRAELAATVSPEWRNYYAEHRDALEEAASLRSEVERLKAELATQEKRANDNGQERDEAITAWRKAENALTQAQSDIRAAREAFMDIMSASSIAGYDGGDARVYDLAKKAHDRLLAQEQDARPECPRNCDPVLGVHLYKCPQYKWFLQYGKTFDKRMTPGHPTPQDKKDAPGGQP